MQLRRNIPVLFLIWIFMAAWLPQASAAEPGKEPAASEGAPGTTGQPAAQAEKEEQAPNPDPRVIVGTQPKFPLKSELLASIDDSDSALKDGDNIDRKTGFLELDLGPLEEVLVALRGCSQEYLKANIKDVTFKQLMLASESPKYRGCVVKRVGILEVFKKMDLSPNLSGITELWRGQISNNAGEIVSFQCIEPLPPDIKVDQPVKLIGIFMQRYSYLNRRAGEMLTLSPLVFIRRLEPYDEVKQVTASNSPISNFVAILACIIIGGGIVAWCFMRYKDRVVADNYFSRLKAEREGPKGYFSKPTTHKQAEKKKPQA
jgi:hypothetical protein